MAKCVAPKRRRRRRRCVRRRKISKRGCKKGRKGSIVRGHYRKMKNGKRKYIRPHRRCVTGYRVKGAGKITGVKKVIAAKPGTQASPPGLIPADVAGQQMAVD